MICKNRLRENFGANADAYDRAAALQKHYAARLGELLRDAGLSPAPVDILEIGCGTGFLTERLFDLFPKARFLITDISPGMVAFCREKLAGTVARQKLSATFRVADGETAPPDGPFDLVVSGFTLQWFADLNAAVHRYRDRTRPAGAFAFSLLLDESFPVLREAFARHHVPFPGPTLPSQAAVEMALSAFPRRDIRVERRTDGFADVADFLRNLNRTGAGNATGRAVPPGQLRKILETCRRLSGETFQADFLVAYGLCRS